MHRYISCVLGTVIHTRDLRLYWCCYTGYIGVKAFFLVFGSRRDLVMGAARLFARGIIHARDGRRGIRDLTITHACESSYYYYFLWVFEVQMAIRQVGRYVVRSDVWWICIVIYIVWIRVNFSSFVRHVVLIVNSGSFVWIYLLCTGMVRRM